MGRDLGGRRVRDAGRRRDVGDAQQGRPGRISARSIYPEFGQCVHKLVMAADGGEHLYQQNHCGVYRSTDGGAEWEEITPGLPSRVRLPDDGPPARPADRVDDPAQRRPTRAGSCPTRRPPCGARTTAARPGSASATGCRSTTPTSGAARGDGQRRPRPGRHLLRDQHGPAVRQRGRGPFVVAGRRQPAADLVGRGASSLADEPACAIVHLPRSLIALFPGTSRRVEAHGSTVAEVIARPRPPGARDRPPRPRRRTDACGPTSTCSSPATGPASPRRSRPAPDVHIIPAVSGG